MTQNNLRFSNYFNVFNTKYPVIVHVGRPNEQFWQLINYKLPKPTENIDNFNKLNLIECMENEIPYNYEEGVY